MNKRVKGPNNNKKSKLEKEMENLSRQLKQKEIKPIEFAENYPVKVEAISKIPEQQNSTSKSDKAIEIKIMIFVTNNESSKVLKPCEKALNFPSSFVTS